MTPAQIARLAALAPPPPDPARCAACATRSAPLLDAATVPPEPGLWDVWRWGSFYACRGCGAAWWAQGGQRDVVCGPGGQVTQDEGKAA